MPNGTDLRSGANGGGAAAVGFLDGNAIPDIVLVAMDRNARGGNQWLFAIGMNCGANGVCAGGWSVGRMPANSFTMKGAGVAIADLDGDGTTNEIILTGVDVDISGQSQDGLRHQGWRYVLARCPGGAAQCTFSLGGVQTVEAQDNLLDANWTLIQEGNVAATSAANKLSTVRGAQIVLSGAVRNAIPSAETRAHIVTRAGRACDFGTGVCEFGPTRSFEHGIRDYLGGQVALLSSNPLAPPSVVYAGIDHRDEDRDNFVVGFETPRTTAFEEFYFGPFDVEEANIRINNDSLATATRLGLSSADRIYEIDRSAGRCPVEVPSCTDDVDFYVVDLPGPTTIDIRMGHNTGSTTSAGVTRGGDLDLQLLDASGALIAASTKGTTGGWVDETITRAVPAGKYFIKVFGFRPQLGRFAATGFYKLRVRGL